MNIKERKIIETILLCAESAGEGDEILGVTALSVDNADSRHLDTLDAEIIAVNEGYCLMKGKNDKIFVLTSGAVSVYGNRLYAKKIECACDFELRLESETVKEQIEEAESRGEEALAEKLKIVLGMFEKGDCVISKELYEEAVRYTLNCGSISASALQRKFLISYRKAHQIMTNMIKDGIIEPPEGSRPAAAAGSRKADK